MKMIDTYRVVITGSMVILTFSCQEFLDIDPPKTQIVSETVYASDQAATSAMVAIYSEMIRDQNAGFASGGGSGITLLAGFSSDELIESAGSASNRSYYQNNVLPDGGVLPSFWQPAYKFIYYSNAVLEGLSRSTQVSETTKKQLEGEAKLVRAFCHFYLVNLFGDVPLVTTTDYKVNEKALRIHTDEVYKQIIQDLTDAQNLLSENYVSPERVRPNRSAATAMLARTYLYLNDWTNAEAQASAVISNAAYSLEADLSDVFLKASDEAIWQLRPVDPRYNTWEGSIFILNATSSTWAKLSPELLNAFEPGDKRRTSWVKSALINNSTLYHPFKYKVKGGNNEPLTEYLTVLRLGEMHLIRAEARAQQNKLQESVTDLDRIRLRAGLPNFNTNQAINKNNILTAIAIERRVELFAEWGHRWLDMKRTNTVDAILAPIKGTNWQPTDALYPIPKSEMENDPNLRPQNPGY